MINITSTFAVLLQLHRTENPIPITLHFSFLRYEKENLGLESYFLPGHTILVNPDRFSSHEVIILIEA